MKLESLQKKLLAAAKADVPSDHVPPAFEQRILAQLRAQPAADPAALWAQAMWRAVIPCVVVALLVSAFAFVPTGGGGAVAGEQDLSQAFEQTLLVAGDSTEEIW